RRDSRITTFGRGRGARIGPKGRHGQPGDRMPMGRQLVDIQRRRFRSSGLAQRKSVSLVNGHPPAQVGQGKVRCAVTTIPCADEVEQLIIFSGVKQSTIAGQPTNGGIIFSYYFDFSDIHNLWRSLKHELKNPAVKASLENPRTNK